MVTEKMIEAAKAEAKALVDRAGIDIGDDHDMFVDDLVQTLTRFAALSTDAEPVRYQRLSCDQWREVEEEDIPYYRSIGQEIRGLYDHPQQPAPSVAVKAEDFARQLWGYFKGDSTGGTTAMQWFDNNKSLGGPAHLIELCRSALSAQVQDVAAYLYTSKSTGGSLVGFKPLKQTALREDEWTCEPLYRGIAKEVSNAG